MPPIILLLGSGSGVIFRPGYIASISASVGNTGGGLFLGR